VNVTDPAPNFFFLSSLNFANTESQRPLCPSKMFVDHHRVPALMLHTWYLICVLHLLFQIVTELTKKHRFDQNLNNFPPIFMMLSFMDGL